MKKRKGFGTVDLAIWAVGLTIFAGAGVFAVNTYMDSGKTATAKAQCASIATAVSRYKFETGAYPVNLNALTGTSGVYGPWMGSLPTADPWDNTNAGINGTGGGTSAYCYSYNTSTGFAVWSVGKNHANNSGGSGTSLPTAFSNDDVGVIVQ